MVNFYSHNTDVKSGDKVSYHGKEYSVVSENKWYTYLQDSEGNTIRVTPESLKEHSAFDVVINDIQNRIDNYKVTYVQRSEAAKINLTNYYKQQKMAAEYKFEADKLLEEGPFELLTKSQKNEYNESIANYKMQRNLADDSDFYHRLNNNAALDCCYSIHTWNNQLMLANTMKRNSIFG